MTLEAVRDEVRRLLVRGDYQGVVDQCRSTIDQIDSKALDQGESRIFRQILNEQSRALRNMGLIQEALECNISALNLAHDASDHLDETWQLVQLGKVFGKYLERQTLFSACLKEAERRYEDLLNLDRPDPALLVRVAIVKDLLGSYYRRIAERETLDRAKCEAAYNEAISLHQAASNPEGVSRATCHLAYARAYFAHIDHNLSERVKKAQIREALIHFERGVRRVLSLDDAIRGRPTRLAQQAHIFLMLGNYDFALRLLFESISLAEERSDPRGLLLARRILGLTYLETGRYKDSAAEFEKSRQIAHEMKFSGLERRVLSELAEAYLRADDPQRAIQVFQYNEELVQRELIYFNSGLQATVDILKKVSPERAERYILEGQRQDYEILISELINNSRLLRMMSSSYERSLSLELQSAIHKFAKSSLRHAVKNHLLNITMRLLDAQLRLQEADTGCDHGIRIFNEANLSINAIKDILGTDSEGQPHGPASLIHELSILIDQYFTTGQASLQISHDVVFPGLLPSLLREALRHLIENAAAAAASSPPLNEPRLIVSQSFDSDGVLLINILNAGENPKTIPLIYDDSLSSSVHGFPNARWFFNEVLGFDCSFTLREEGPRTLPNRTNCVEIRIPPPGTTLTQFYLAPLDARE